MGQAPGFPPRLTASPAPSQGGPLSRPLSGFGSGLSSLPSGLGSAVGGPAPPASGLGTVPGSFGSALPTAAGPVAGSYGRQGLGGLPGSAAVNAASGAGGLQQQAAALQGMRLGGQLSPGPGNLGGLASNQAPAPQAALGMGPGAILGSFGGQLPTSMAPRQHQQQGFGAPAGAGMGAGQVNSAVLSCQAFQVLTSRPDGATCFQQLVWVWLQLPTQVTLSV